MEKKYFKQYVQLIGWYILGLDEYTVCEIYEYY